METKTWWKVQTYSLDIVPVQVIKETEKQIHVLRPATTNAWGTTKESTHREFKHSGGDGHYPTWEQAQAALLDRLLRKAERAEQELAKTKADMLKVQSMEPGAVNGTKLIPRSELPTAGVSPALATELATNFVHSADLAHGETGN